MDWMAFGALLAGVVSWVVREVRKSNDARCHRDLDMSDRYGYEVAKQVQGMMAAGAVFAANEQWNALMTSTGNRMSFNVEWEVARAARDRWVSYFSTCTAPKDLHRAIVRLEDIANKLDAA